MNREMIQLKEEAILFAKDKMEDAAEAISEFFPDLAEELNWFLEELGNCLTAVRSERLAMVENPMYVGGGMG